MEGFGKAALGIALNSTESHESFEGACVEPGLFALRGEVREQVLDFLPSDGFGKRDEKVGSAKIAFVFGDFVFENQMITECVPG